MKVFLFLGVLCCMVLKSEAQEPWQSSLVSINGEGDLTYHEDEDGFIIPDFSHAGYKGGGIDIPKVETIKEISPIPGDNTQHIQDAINAVGIMSKNSEGIRGAVLLKAGKYEVYGTLRLKFDGVVLRGEGDGADTTTSTIIHARGNSPRQRDVIVVGNINRFGGQHERSGTRSYITDGIVPVGSYTFRVDNSSLYEVGDQVSIYHPATQAWVEAVDYGGVPYPDPSAPNNPDERWEEGQLPILFNRYVVNIEGDQITVDAPVFYSLDKTISPCYIFKPNMSGVVSQVGLEDLRIDIETNGGTDENHAWQAVRFKSCENAWATDCTFLHFGQSGIITEACTRSSFLNCNAIEPVGKITGERMYNFNTYHYSQLNLFAHCYANKGRHHYVSNGTSTTSGNVFLRCTSDATNSVSEGHRQWTQGMLYDNHIELNMKRDFVLGLYNRVAKGTGHGWSAVHSVLWNCDVNSSYGEIGIQKPPTAQNYAIGCMAKSITGAPISDSKFAIGFVEGKNKKGLEPESLYEAQLAARLKNTSISKMEEGLVMKVYPTVVGNQLHIKTSDNFQRKVIQIVSITGAIVKEKTSYNSLVTIPTSSMVEGVYILRCRVNKQVTSSKFIKN